MLAEEERDYQDVIRKLQNIDILSSRINSTNKIKNLAECVKKPCDPLPENPLPRWKTIPLDQKFPVIPSAPGQFPFSRNTIGNSLFLCACSSPEFDTEDPYIRHTPIEYDPLHDPNLKIYFQENPQLIRNLEQMGFINHYGKVICSTSNYNKYRAYLSRIHKRNINKERQRLEDVADADFKKVKSIKHYLFKENNLNREAAAKARMEESRAVQAQRHLRTQFGRVHRPSTKYRDQLARERACLRQRQDFLRQKKQAKMKQMNEEQLNHNRHVVLEWHCRDLYFQRFRQALAEYKKTLHRVEMEDFVRCKREYQEEKVRYERAIGFRVKAERECSVIKRKERYEKLEIIHKESLKRKEENELKKADRDLYLIRKYGRRWLAIVEAKRKAVSTYHDSLWATRGQLREVVTYLREESGTKSFTGFIQDIIKRKPGKPVMSEGTKEVVEYIMKTLLEAAYKEYIRKATSTALDFLDQETLDQLERVKCRKGDVIRVEDFIPPVVRRRFKPQIPFIRPPWPCCGPCAGLNVKEKDEDWEQRCRDMACCLESINHEISKFLIDRMCSAMTNTLCKGLPKPCSEEEPCFIDELCEEAHYISDGQIQRMARKKKPSSKNAKALTRKVLAKVACKTNAALKKNATLLSKPKNKTLIGSGTDSAGVSQALAKDAHIRAVGKDRRPSPNEKQIKRDSSGSQSSGRDSGKSDVGSEIGTLSDLSDTAEGAVKNAIKKTLTNRSAEGKLALTSGGNEISSSATEDEAGTKAEPGSSADKRDTGPTEKAADKSAGTSPALLQDKGSESKPQGQDKGTSSKVNTSDQPSTARPESADKSSASKPDGTDKGFSASHPDSADKSSGISPNVDDGSSADKSSDTGPKANAADKSAGTSTGTTDKSSGISPNVISADKSSDTGPKENAADKSSETGPKTNAADKSSDTGPKTNAADKSSETGPKENAADKSSETGPKTNAADKSDGTSTGTAEKSSGMSPNVISADKSSDTGPKTNAADKSDGTSTGTAEKSSGMSPNVISADKSSDTGPKTNAADKSDGTSTGTAEKSSGMSPNVISADKSSDTGPKTNAADKSSDTGPKTNTADKSSETGPKANAADKSSDTGPKTNAADKSSDTGPKANAADKSSDTGPKANAADKSSDTGPKANAADKSSETGPKANAADKSSDTGPKTNAADKSSETGPKTNAADKSDGTSTGTAEKSSGMSPNVISADKSSDTGPKTNAADKSDGTSTGTAEKSSGMSPNVISADKSSDTGPKTNTADKSSETGPKANAADKSSDTGPKTNAADKSSDTGPKANAADKSSDTGPKANAADKSSDTGPKANAADKSSETGPKANAADKSSDTGPKTNAADKSSETGPKANAADKSSDTGPKTNAADKSSETGPKENAVDKSDGTSTGTAEKSSGMSPNVISADKSSETGPKANAVDKSDGTSTGTAEKSSGISPNVNSAEKSSDTDPKVNAADKSAGTSPVTSEDKGSESTPQGKDKQTSSKVNTSDQPSTARPESADKSSANKPGGTDKGLSASPDSANKSSEFIPSKGADKNPGTRSDMADKNEGVRSNAADKSAGTSTGTADKASEPLQLSETRDQPTTNRSDVQTQYRSSHIIDQIIAEQKRLVEGEMGLNSSIGTETEPGSSADKSAETGPKANAADKSAGTSSALSQDKGSESKPQGQDKGTSSKVNTSDQPSTAHPESADKSFASKPDVTDKGFSASHPDSADKSSGISPNVIDGSSVTTDNQIPYKSQNEQRPTASKVSAKPSQTESEAQFGWRPSQFINQIIQEQKRAIETEMAVIGSGDENLGGMNVSDSDISRMASELTDAILCEQMQGIGVCPSRSRTQSRIVGQRPQSSRTLRDGSRGAEDSMRRSHPGQQSSVLSHIATIGLGAARPRSDPNVDNRSMRQPQIQPARTQQSQDSAVLDQIAQVGLGVPPTTRPGAGSFEVGGTPSGIIEIIPVNTTMAQSIMEFRIPSEQFVRQHTLPVESEFSSVGLHVHHNPAVQQIRTLDGMTGLSTFDHLGRASGNVSPEPIQPQTPVQTLYRNEPAQQPNINRPSENNMIANNLHPPEPTPSDLSASVFTQLSNIRNQIETLKADLVRQQQRRSQNDPRPPP